jgi:hypothetical protein
MSLSQISRAADRERATMVSATFNDYAAVEVGLRKRIELMGPRELVARRAKLLALGRAADPMLSRCDELERTIEHAEEWARILSREREAIEASAEVVRRGTGAVSRAAATQGARPRRTRGDAGGDGERRAQAERSHSTA